MEQNTQTKRNVVLEWQSKLPKRRRVYTPPHQKLGELNAIDPYLRPNRTFSLDKSEERRQTLKNKRNLLNFTAALMPIIMEKYYEKIQK